MTKYEELPDSTRVWIYQANKPFETSDLPEVKMHITQFVKNWVSHNNQLRAFGDVLHNRFVVLMVDESQAGASGCSIDKSVNFLRALQDKYQLDLFDRMIFSYIDNEKVESVDRDTFARLYAEGSINDSTPVFDTLVKNKAELDEALIKPLGTSWHKRMV